MLNIELKAHCFSPAQIEELLHQKKAVYKGEDHQVDTYFKVSRGRLKLREGRIENALIRYQRPEVRGLKRSEVTLYKINGDSKNLKTILEDTLGIDIIVEKWRKIFFIGNVKFHIDRVISLGQFVEIEAIDSDGTIGEQELRQQCRYYMDLFNISDNDLVKGSYSDMLSARD